jgi:hypothetical protein
LFFLSVERKEMLVLIVVDILPMSLCWSLISDEIWFVSKLNSILINSFYSWMCWTSVLESVSRGGQRSGLGRCGPKNTTRPKLWVKIYCPHRPKLGFGFDGFGLSVSADRSDRFRRVEPYKEEIT